jgi:hypothetical protein
MGNQFVELIQRFRKNDDAFSRREPMEAAHVARVARRTFNLKLCITSTQVTIGGVAARYGWLQLASVESTVANCRALSPSNKLRYIVSTYNRVTTIARWFFRRADQSTIAV